MLCGLVGEGWLHLDTRPTVAEALADHNLCRRCAAKLKH